MCLLPGLLAAGVAFGAPFTAIRVGDVDGFGYGSASGFVAAGPGLANVDGLGILTSGDYLPDIDNSGVTATAEGDDFDLRDAAEAAGTKITGSGFTNTGTTGSTYTDISLSTSYDTSQAGGDVLVGTNPNVFGAGGAFPGDGNPNTLSNQPGFVFDFTVAGADIVAGTPVFFNLLFGDYDVTPATIRFTRADSSTFNLAVATQPAGNDGLIQGAAVALGFFDVFTALGPDWDGYLKVDFLAPNEPYTAFDYVELSVEPFRPAAVPEPGTLALLAGGLAAFARRRRR